MADSWSIYVGSTFALTGDIEEPGWRLRTTNGYGRYRYSKSPDGMDTSQAIKLRGQIIFSALLLGHHFQWQRLTFKVFAGLTSAQHLIDLNDPDQPTGGTEYGGKAALEAWLAVTDVHWLAGNLSWEPTLLTSKIGLRGGFAALDDLDIGFEAQWHSSPAYEAGRIGGFATWRIDDVGLTLAAGATGQFNARPSHYGRLNLFLRY